MWNIRSVQRTEASIAKLIVCAYFGAYLESLSCFLVFVSFVFYPLCF